MHIKLTQELSMSQILSLKKPTNVNINSELLLKAKQLKINLSATLEAALIEVVNAKQRELWKLENTAAIKAYNELVASQGVFSDEFRSF
jgi:antitoxin CcdA